jgi:signal transduction histidine kinase
LAVIGLAAASLFGRRLEFQSVWPSLFVVASIVALYNLFFRWLLRLGGPGTSESFASSLRIVAVYEMAMDLIALTVTIHFTGGLQSPLLPFFAFHMAIGTMMITSRLTYVLAGAVSAGALLVFLLEVRGAIGFHPLVAGTGLDMQVAALNLLTLIVALFGIVYLTDSVVTRLKQRSLELYETSEALGDRTEELQRLLGEMEELERRKSHYMRISAHQLRSPLGTIKTALRVMRKGYIDPGSEAGAKMLDGAAEVTDGLLAVINDLLELAKMREGRSKAPWSKSVNLNQLIADLFDTLVPDAERRDVTLKPEFKGVAILDWGVPPDLVHAFENLIYNGIKYNRAGGSVVVELESADEAAIVRVIDSGIGISAEYLDQVFLEFVRAPNAKHHTSEGTGLGLAIVKEVVETHGGNVAASSREGEGTTFTVRLPLHHTPIELKRLLLAGNDPGYEADTPSEVAVRDQNGV